VKEYKIIKTKPSIVPLCYLNYQFIPELINHDIWHYDMSLPNSPQVECARLLLKYGKNWNKLKYCRFAEDRRHRFKMGMKKWTEKAIKEHILGSRYNILMSIKKRGFDMNRNKKQPVLILMEPLWRTRFKYNAEWLTGYEIYHGGRRCASMYALGHKYVPALAAKDSMPGTNKGGKFENKVMKLI